jgi:hypothetical protein
MSTQLQMEYSTRGASHHVLLTRIQAWRINNKDYMKYPQEGVKE